MIFPGNGHRHTIVGMTGTGKTIFGLWCLSRRDFDRMPWIVFDFKLDENISEIPGLQEIKLGSLPKRRGLYVVRPTVEDAENGVLTDYFYDILAHGKIGIFIDETYSVPRLDTGFRTLLTQGRSKKTPVIALTQRPAWVSPFLFSESEFISVFYLNTPADCKRIREFIPRAQPENLIVENHQSYWYQAGKRNLTLFGACPGIPEIMDTFDRKKVPSRWI